MVPLTFWLFQFPPLVKKLLAAFQKKKQSVATWKRARYNKWKGGEEGGRTQNCEAAAIQLCNDTSACELGTSTQNEKAMGCPSGLQVPEKQTNKST